jgi:hypothetical protein
MENLGEFLMIKAALEASRRARQPRSVGTPF